MKKERREIEKGVFAQVEVCPRCKDQWIDEKGYDEIYRLFIRKAFKIGGSLAVRIPKEIADTVGLKEGSDVRFTLKDNKILIEPVTCS
jgi:AbrB family looped-hinge helix DNA binding protein